MAKENSITKKSYLIKRLVDCGYKVKTVVGETSISTLNSNLETFLDNKFTGDINRKNLLEFLKDNRQTLARFLDITPNYSRADSREFTILIDGGGSSVFLTLYRNSKGTEDDFESRGDHFFELFDGGQYVQPLRKRIQTVSFEVIIEELNKMGIIHKKNGY